MTWQNAGASISSLITEKTVDAECHIHGPYKYTYFYVNGKTPQTVPECPHCLEEKHRKEDRIRRQEAARKQMLSLLATKGIPEALAGCSLDNFKPHTPFQAEALKRAQWFVSEFHSAIQPRGIGLLIYGNCGTGKTHLSIAILKALYRVDSRYIQALDLFREIRRSFSDKNDSEDSILGKFRSYDLLVIDEFCLQTGSVFERNTLFSLLDYRFSNRKPTILITNKDADELIKYIDEPLVDRIKHCCVPVLIAGPSERKPLYEGLL